MSDPKTYLSHAPKLKKQISDTISTRILIGGKSCAAQASAMSIPAHLQGYQALRRGRWSQAGQIYLLTTVTHHREPHFLDWSVASTAASIMADARNWPGANLLCWVLMPDHWHGIVELTGDAPLSGLMRTIKGRSAHAINRVSGRKGPVWMFGFHDHALRSDLNVLDAARYLVANPLRAGLVDRVGDYPYWDSIWLSPGNGSDGVGSVGAEAPPTRTAPPTRPEV